MKVKLISVMTVCILLLAGIYVFIPATLTISEVSIINCTINGVNRYLSDESKWTRWWPGTASSRQPDFQEKKSFLSYNAYSYHVTKPLYNQIEVLTLTSNGSRISSSINFFSLHDDSVAVQWQYRIATSKNPIKRFFQYLSSRTIKKNVADILTSLKSFLEKKENVYGIKVKKIRTKEALFVTTKCVFTNYPVRSPGLLPGIQMVVQVIPCHNQK